MPTSPVVAVLAVVASCAAGCATAEPHRADVERRVQGRAGATAFPGEGSRLGASMSVDDVVAVALARNAGLQADLRSVDASVGDWIAAGAVANPELELEAHFPVGASDGALGVEGALLQELNSLFARAASRTAAKYELERTKIRATAAVLSLGARARQAAFEYIAARELLELRRITLESADASWEVATRLREAGNVSRLEVAQRQATREQARLDVRSMERAVAVARESLNRVMGLYGADASDWELVAELPEVPAQDELPLENLESHAVGASLALEAGRFSLEAAGARGKLAAWNAWPHLAVGVFAEAEVEEGFTTIGPALEISLPLWAPGRGRLIAAEGRVLEERARYEQNAVELRADVREARETLVEAGDRARFLRDVLIPLRREITGEMLERYNAMHEGVFELLAARQAETDATAQWIEAVRDYWVARARVDLVLQGGDASPSSMSTSGTASRPSFGSALSADSEEH